MNSRKIQGVAYRLEPCHVNSRNTQGVTLAGALPFQLATHTGRDVQAGALPCGRKKNTGRDIQAGAWPCDLTKTHGVIYMLGLDMGQQQIRKLMEKPDSETRKNLIRETNCGKPGFGKPAYSGNRKMRIRKPGIRETSNRGFGN